MIILAQLMDLAQDRETAVNKRDTVLAITLHALGWADPGARIELDFRPERAEYLTTARGCEDQEFERPFDHALARSQRDHQRR
jgi:hypothetical protein